MNSFKVPDGELPGDFVLNQKDNTNHLYVATMSGTLHIAAYEQSGWSIKKSLQIFKKPIRKVLLSDDTIFVGSSTGRIYVLDCDGNVLRKPKFIRNSDGDPIEISSMCTLTDSSDGPDTFNLAVGDDLGNVYILKLAKGSDEWEIVETLEEQDDSITSVHYHPYRKTLLASSGDGTLLVYDLKKSKIIAHSTSLDDEILSLIVDSDDNVICSTGSGALVSYKWGYWGKVNARLKPSFHSSSSINSIHLVSHEDKPMLITGAVDGSLRSVDLQKRFVPPDYLHQFEDSIEKISSFEVMKPPLVAVSFSNDSIIEFFQLNPKELEPDHQPPIDSGKKRQKKTEDTSASLKNQIGTFFSGWVARVSEMAGGAQSWKKFVPYDVAPIIAAMGFVTCLASYRIFSIARLPDVKFTKNGGTHDWQERVSADSQDKQNEEHA